MEKNLHDLIKDIKQGKQTVLFLGTGADYSYDKRMLWNDVMHEFVQNSVPLLNMSPSDIKELRDTLDPCSRIERHPTDSASEFSTESKVSVIKRLLGNDYVPLLQNIIYSQATKEDMEKGCNQYLMQGANSGNTTFYSLFAIAEFILKHDNIRAVVSYNFDNLLTQAIRLLQQHPEHFGNGKCCQRLNCESFRPTDIYSGWADEPFTNAVFPIYHPHGYIQPPEELIPNKRNQVVMSMEEFYDSAKAVYSWQHATQIHFLTHYMCIYIGASLTDMNMQRLLSFADIEHNNESIYYLMRVNNAQSRLKSFFHTANHLRVVASDNYQNLYNELLNDNNYVQETENTDIRS